VLTATTNASLITGTVVTTSTTATQTLLVVNTATGSGELNQISKRDFLSDVYSNTIRPGMIVPFGGETAPESWLLCNGAQYPEAEYPALYGVIGKRYTNTSTVVLANFQVPNFVTTASGGYVVNYIIKT